MNQQVTYLNPPRRPAPRADKPKATLQLGRRYTHTSPQPVATMHGLCRGIVLSRQKGHLVAADQTDNDYFVWDCDADLGQLTAPPDGGPLQVAANRLILAHTSLDKPLLQQQDAKPWLSLSVHFDLRYSADAMSARLGVIHVVESNAFFQLANGERHVILNTGDEDKALYLSPAAQQGIEDEAVHTILDAVQDHELATVSHSETIRHSLREQVGGMDVESMTVLEHYQTFFMHRELPFSDDNIWVPALPPLTWGWSMRVARRYDGEWGIARQKLLMPTSDPNGMTMPSWRGNTLDMRLTD